MYGCMLYGDMVSVTAWISVYGFRHHRSQIDPDHSGVKVDFRPLIFQ